MFSANFVNAAMASILLAEDDPSIRKFLVDALERAGHKVTAADSGVAALALLERTRPDLLVTDILMPGMDGVELARRARAAAPEVRVMFITGFAAVALGDGATAGGERVLSKPFHLRHLVAEIAAMFPAAAVLEDTPDAPRPA